MYSYYFKYYFYYYFYVFIIIIVFLGSEYQRGKDTTHVHT